MKKYLRYLGHFVVAAIFILAIWLLYNKLKGYSIAQIQMSLERISLGRIVFSLGLMVINYLILVGYDWLALRAIHKTLPLSRVGLVSFVGQAVSYNFGALLGGTSVRYRFYSAWGFTLIDIVRLVLMLAVTFWVGALGLCGLIFIFAPPVIPDALLASMPIKDVRILGMILTAISFSYLCLCFFIRSPIHIFGKEFIFPSPKIAVAQCLVASIDIVAAAACMYVLLPGDIGISFVEFLPGYLMAMVAVVLTHIPGGVGIFELVILELTHTPQEQTVFAVVLLFRLIYYIIPLLAAALLLALYEARQRKDMLRDAGRWLSVLSHSIAAYLTFACGIIFMVSALLPTMPRNIPAFFKYLPDWTLIVGSLICSLSGAALLFVAYGLERRQSIAFKLAITLFLTGIFGALLKDFSWLTAIMGAIILLSICFTTKRFYRNSSFFEEKFPISWLLPVFCALICDFGLGWFIYHPAWGRAARWGFDQSLNASSAIIDFCSIGLMVLAFLIWRLVKLARKVHDQS